MNFNVRSSALVGQHAFLSPSKYHWMKYDEEKLTRVYNTQSAINRGIKHHALAQNLITLGVKLPEIDKTLNLYVNDAIGYRMTPEITMFYSDNCFGTADAASFRRNKLRIHDLKTGITQASMHQLEGYAAIFCLEYKFSPLDIEIELRIYQNDMVRIHIPDPDDIFHIMDKIVTLDKLLNYLKAEES